MQALRNYSESYEYDAVGNFEILRHLANGGGWTRRYVYNEDSLIEAGKKNNRLTRTIVGNGINQIEPYTHNAHGNMTTMPHLAAMVWDFEDQLQQVDTGGSTAYYLYDAGGQRVRKVIETQNGTRQKERIYLGGFEIYREFSGNGATATLARESLHVMDDKQRIAIVETQTIENGNPVNTPVPLRRYQFGNHLGSASVELDKDGALISYEEYHPYGTTAFQAGRSAAEVSLKRYRYTGKERDEETGLCYYGARYYAPWLGRWTKCDPLGLADGPNFYAFVGENPINLVDPSGMVAKPPSAASALESTGSKLIGDNEFFGPLWEKAVKKVLPPELIGKTYGETMKLFEAHINQLKVTKGWGSNKKAGTAINVARKTYSKVRSAFGKLVEEAGVSLKDIQLHHGIGTAGELANAPEKALDATALHLAKGNAATVGSEHNLLTELNKNERLNNWVSKLTKTEVQATEAAVKEGGTAIKQVAKTAGKEALVTAEKTGLKEGAKLLGTKAAKFIPFVGIGIGIGLVGNDIRKSDYASASWDAAEAIPIVGDVVGAGHFGITVGGALNEGLGIEKVASDHGMAIEGAVKSLGLSQDTSRIIGATGAALSSITVAPTIALQRTISGWFK